MKSTRRSDKPGTRSATKFRTVPAEYVWRIVIYTDTRAVRNCPEYAARGIRLSFVRKSYFLSGEYPGSGHPSGVIVVRRLAASYV
jgi:hypothetical protein